jgi:hypothetical protein
MPGDDFDESHVFIDGHFLVKLKCKGQNAKGKDFF